MYKSHRAVDLTHVASQQVLGCLNVFRELRGSGKYPALRGHSQSSNKHVIQGMDWVSSQFHSGIHGYACVKNINFYRERNGSGSTFFGSSGARGDKVLP